MSVGANKTGATARKPRRGIASGPLRLLLIALLLLAAIGAWVWLSPLFAERNLQSASLATLQSLATQEKNNERVLYYLAQRQEESGQLREAMTSYNHALELDQDDEAAWFGWVRTTNTALGASQALEVLKTWLLRNPHNATAYGLQAHLYQKRGDHLAAYEAASKAVAITPKDGDLWQLMGAEAAALDRPSDAENAFRQAIACNSSDWRNYAGHADALSRLARHPEAIADFRQAAKLAPELGVTHLLLGVELLDSATNDTDIAAARAELLSAISKGSSLPNSAQLQATQLLGDSYKRQHQWQDALSWYQKAEQLSPYDPTIQFNLIAIYRGLGDTNSMQKAEARHQELTAYDHDLKVLVEHLATMPEDLPARLKLARLYANHGATEQAIAAYTELLARSPDRADARQELQQLQKQNTAPKP